MPIRYVSPLNRLVDVLMRLPGVGAKTAQRLAFYLLKAPREEAMKLAEAIVEIKEKIRVCGRCYNIAEEEQCTICQDPTRDGSVLCVVEEPNDLMAIERTGTFKGRYHVLQGSLSPIEGRGPDQITAMGMLERLRSEGVKEVILATNPNMEGAGHPDRPWPPGRGRPRVCRRDHPGAGPGGPPGVRLAGMA
jgi:recombination protein RecR